MLTVMLNIIHLITFLSLFYNMLHKGAAIWLGGDGMAEIFPGMETKTTNFFDIFIFLRNSKNLFEVALLNNQILKSVLA